ncbi:Crp/Fnr family transcriptional regulator [Chelativorans sp. AA-79]|uniref:Crp/Fnr family transcriptional regulator n=1 Tax=Chelativorans sp. AA-79 TaxID=3028735 RepID=UPI0023F6518E|nr:Crp/Fnr family transcriptional regulator [Chelativorans sp. AA-79]WEX08559.1 Crp/Fnr family transcriptional regulator [Chelativorans sp. AA-79]
MECLSALDILNQAELFHDVPYEVLKDIQALGFPVHATQHAPIFHQGDEATTLYIVLGGHLRTTQTTPCGHQLILRYLGPGGLAGHAVLSGDQYHPATVVAVKESHLIGWSRNAIRQIMACHSVVAMNALNILGQRYHEMQQRLTELSTEDAEHRIARTVLRLIRQAGRRTARGIELAFPLSRQDLAEMTGTTLHTVSRTFSAWEGRGLVASGRRKVIVREPHQLALIASEGTQRLRDVHDLLDPRPLMPGPKARTAGSCPDASEQTRKK